MSNDLELIKSAKDNIQLSRMCLDGIFEAVDNLINKKSITLGDLALNSGQIALASFGYYIFGNAAIEDVRQLAGNISVEIEESKKTTVNVSKTNLSIINPILGFPSYMYMPRKAFH